VKCLIYGKKMKCKTIENYGWSHWHNCYSKCVRVVDKQEYIVIKKNGVWRTLEIYEKIGKPGTYCGQ